VKLVVFLCVVALVGVAVGSGRAGEPIAYDSNRFDWVPPSAPAAAYRLEETADRHRVVFFPDERTVGSSAPVVVGFHGQPARGKAPRDYAFAGQVLPVIDRLVREKRLPPLVLVLPTFRYVGENWPAFDLRAFRNKVDGYLRNRNARFQASAWLLFGHSGAAGCGGDGLNRPTRIGAGLQAVGFFDTCLGGGWREALAELEKSRVPVYDLRAVETAGFRPRQSPEYQSGFDFGRAWEPLGVRPVSCPARLPGKLKDRRFRCSASASGFIRAFALDTGEGAAAHEAMIAPAVEFFLTETLGGSAPD